MWIALGIAGVVVILIGLWMLVRAQSRRPDGNLEPVLGTDVDDVIEGVASAASPFSEHDDASDGDSHDGIWGD